MTTFSKRMKVWLISALSLLMAVCVIASVGSVPAKAESQKIEYKVFETNFDGVTLSNGRADSVYAVEGDSIAKLNGGARTATDSNAGYYNNEITRNSTALHYGRTYIEFFPIVITEGFDYAFYFDAARSTLVETTNDKSRLQFEVLVNYNEGGAAKETRAFMSDMIYVYKETLWATGSFKLNYTLNNGAVTVNLKDSATSSASIMSTTKDYTGTVGTSVEKVNHIRVRIYSQNSAGKTDWSWVYLDNVKCALSFDVDSNLFTAGQEKAPVDGELISGGNFSEATVGTTNASTYYANKAKTIYSETTNGANRGITEIVSNGYAGSNAIVVNNGSGGNYINAKVTGLEADKVYEFSYDIRLYNPDYSSTVVPSATFDTWFGFNNGANATAMETAGRPTLKSNANGENWATALANNVEDSLGETFEKMYKGETYCGWTTVKYQFSYSFVDGKLQLNTVRLGENSEFITYKTDAEKQFTINCSSATNILFRVYTYAPGTPVVIDNLSLVEIKQDITNGAVNVYVDAEGNIYDKAAEGLTEVSLKLENGYGASIRYDVETPGIRFRAMLNKEGFDLLGVGAKNVEIGMLFGATDKVGTELKIGQAGVVKKANDLEKSWYLNAEGDKYCYNMSVIQIAEKNYNDNITVQSYMIITFANGETITVYGEIAEIQDGDVLASNVRSVGGVAQTLIDGGKETDAGRLEILNKFAGNN